MKNYQQPRMLVFIQVLIMTLLAGCGSETTNDTSTTESSTEVSKPNYGSTFTMAVEKNYPPYVIKDEFGKVSGFDVELMQAIANESKFNIQFIVVDRQQAFSQLADGKFNVFGSGVGINEDRMNNFYISNPYMTSRAVFATSDTAITNENEILGKIIARQPSNYYYDKVKTAYGDNNQFMDFPTTFLAYAETAGDSQIIFVDDIHVINYIKKSYEGDADIPEISVFPALNNEKKQIAFVIEKGNGDLLNKVNNGLDAVIKDGTFDTLYKKWFSE